MEACRRPCEVPRRGATEHMWLYSQSKRAAWAVCLTIQDRSAEDMLRCRPPQDRHRVQNAPPAPADGIKPPEEAAWYFKARPHQFYAKQIRPVKCVSSA
eukprot:1191351-Prorocentrum_minimum.AAC.1